MKTPSTIALLSAFFLISTLAAQEVAVEAPKSVTADTPAAAQQQRKLQAEERVRTLLEKKPVVYSGFLVDASRAEKKSRFFSLRQPRDPRNDIRNISFEERSGKPRGFVLFRVEF